MSVAESLWPRDLLENIPTVPAELLAKQGELLGKHTNNIVVGKVYTESDSEGDFIINFVLTAPPLGRYEYTLFSLYHGPELYPVKTFDADTSFSDESELRTFLRDIFSTPKTTRIVRALIAQARSRTKPQELPDDIPF